MRFACLCANDSALDHTVAGRTVGDESRGNRHLQDHVFIARYPFDGDENASGGDVHGSAEFEDRTAFGIGAVYENWESDWEPLPTAGLALGFTHALNCRG